MRDFIKVGEVFNCAGVRLKAKRVKHSLCVGCYGMFHKHELCSDLPQCGAEYRKDGQHVIFVKVSFFFKLFNTIKRKVCRNQNQKQSK